MTRNGRAGVRSAVRCAIYTRKSTEEGLQQEFNSLDAQREAGEAYIASQAGEGWIGLPQRYDDGGYTGGNMERPALAMLDRVRRKQPLDPESLGADGAFSAGPFLREVEQRGVTPYVPIPTGPIRGEGPPSDARRRARQRMRSAAYRTAQRVRKRVEEIIGWCKRIGGLARTRFVGRWKIAQQAYITGAAYNLLRLARLKPVAA